MKCQKSNKEKAMSFSLFMFAMWLMKCVTSHPVLGKKESWMLKTKDTHGLCYTQIGFRILQIFSLFVRETNLPVNLLGGSEFFNKTKSENQFEEKTNKGTKRTCFRLTKNLI